MKNDLTEGEDGGCNYEKLEGRGEAVHEDSYTAEKHAEHREAFTAKSLDQITCRTLKDADCTGHSPKETDLEGGDVKLCL